MARILLVDNDQDWLDLIARSLPEHEVDTAISYDAGVQAIRSGSPYDVAIIDLNLIDSPNRYTKDELGGKILDMLRDEYPSTRRIALTADTPSSVRQVLDKYDVHDLLLKKNMAFAVIGEAVKAALEGTSAPLAPGAQGLISDMRQDWRGWRHARAWQLDQQLQGLRNDLRSPAHGPAGASGGNAVASLQARLSALEALKKDFSQACSRVEAMMGRASSAGDIAAIRDEIGKLRQRFGTDGGIAEQ